MSIFKKISVFTMLCVMSILFLTPFNAKAATIGLALPNPESGWQRVDDTDSTLIYNGTFLTDTHSTYWNGSGQFCSTTTDSSITFKFYGTKLRLIASLNWNRISNNIVTIDDVSYNFNEYKSTSVMRALVFEKTGLELGIHTVTIKPNYTTTATVITLLDAIDIDDTGYLVDYYHLEATPGNANVTLKWDETTDVSGYVIHYGITSGNLTETKTVSGSAITVTTIDGLSNGTTYYFSISAVRNGVESTPSIEVSATPAEEPASPGHTGNTATLILTMTNGDDKVYNLSLIVLDNFLIWYDSKSAGTGKAYYVFTKTESISPYVSVKEYVSYDKISNFEVKEYNQ